jgi:hypothetical protein
MVAVTSPLAGYVAIGVRPSVAVAANRGGEAGFTAVRSGLRAERRQDEHSDDREHGDERRLVLMMCHLESSLRLLAKCIGQTELST